MNVPLRPSLFGIAEFRIAGLLALFGSLLVVVDDRLARLLARTIPGRGEVSSAGTAFPQFAEVVPTIIRRNGLLLIVAAIVLVASRLVRGERQIPDWAGLAASVTAALSSALWIGWLATPHNAFPSNARIHWVDYLTDKSDNYFYAAGRVPHLIFYDAPPLWQAINALILVGLTITIGRQLGAGWALAVGFGLVVATSGNLLRFANTAEDVYINVALVLAVISASLTRRPVILGLALAAVLLGRPQFAVIFPGVVLAELLALARRRERPSRALVRHVAITTGVTAIGVVVCQLLFTVLGRRYFLTNGNLVDIDELANVTARPIDGFTIFPISGAYLLHFGWVLPAGTLVLAGLGVIRARRLDLRHEVTVYFCAYSVIALLVLHEVRPLLYFNIRYVTYLMPFLLVMAWTAVVSFSPRRSPGSPRSARRARGDRGTARAGHDPSRSRRCQAPNREPTGSRVVGCARRPAGDHRREDRVPRFPCDGNAELCRLRPSAPCQRGPTVA